MTCFLWHLMEERESPDLHNYCGAWNSRWPELTPGQAAGLPTGGFEAVDVNVTWLVIFFPQNDSAVVENETKKLFNLQQKKAPKQAEPSPEPLVKGMWRH